jgi:hypothetical protein
MNKLEQLAKIVLKEAPLSSYLKAVGRTVTSPAAYAKGAANVLSGAQKAANVFTTSTKSLPTALGAAAGGAQKVAGGLTAAGKWVKQPGPEKPAANKKTPMRVPAKGNRVDILYGNTPTVGKIQKAKETNISNAYYVRLQNRLPQTNKTTGPVDGLLVINLKAGGTYVQPLKGNRTVGASARGSLKAGQAPENWILQA